MGWVEALDAGYVADVAVQVLEDVARGRESVDVPAVLQLIAEVFDALVAREPAAATAAARRLMQGPGCGSDEMVLWRVEEFDENATRALTVLRAGLLHWAVEQGDGDATFALRCTHAISAEASMAAGRGGSLTREVLLDGLERPWRWPALEAAAAHAGVHPVDEAVADSLGDAAFRATLGARRLMLGASPVPCEVDRWWGVPADDALCAPLDEQAELAQSPAFDAAARLLVAHTSSVDVAAMDPLWFSRVTPGGALHASGVELPPGAVDVFAALWADELDRQLARRVPRQRTPRPQGRSLAELADASAASVAVL